MSSTSTRRARRLAVAGLSVTVAMTLAACSSGGTTTGSTSSASGSSSASSASGSATSSAAAAKVAALEKAPGYDIPTGSIAKVASLKGKTVYYIPINQQAPQFAVTQAALQTALGKAGVKLQVCNGQSTPTGIAACLTQATKAQAGAIITDAIPYVLAANAFAAAESAGIPVLNTDQVEDSAHPAAAKLGYIYAAGSRQMQAVADWIAADSGGKATIVIDESTDGPSPVAFVEAGVQELKSVCSACTVSINKISSANFSLIPSSTSSALLKTPNVGYVVSEFDQYLQPVQGGVQQAGKASSVKGVSGAAQLSGLQQLSNKNFLYADVGQGSAYQGWADADAVLRMMTGTSGASLPTYTIPIRLFTRDNVGDVTLTSAAQASGEWFGSADYTSKFLTLWGLG